NATISLSTCRGSVSRPLGLLAATMGLHDEAVAHFEAALRLNARMGARPLVAMTTFDYARSLVRRGDPQALEKARPLAQQALPLASVLGTRALARRCEAFLRDLGTDEQPQGAADDFHLAKDGHFWTLSSGERRVLLKDAKGLTYLAELMRHPGRDVHVLDLI